MGVGWTLLIKWVGGNIWSVLINLSLLDSPIHIIIFLTSRALEGRIISLSTKLKWVETGFDLIVPTITERNWKQNLWNMLRRMGWSFSRVSFFISYILETFSFKHLKNYGLNKVREPIKNYYSFTTFQISLPQFTTICN